MKPTLLPILTFALFAFAFSWLANRFVPALMLGPIDLKTILTGLGPAGSGLLCYALFKTPNTYHISLAGNKPLLISGLVLLALLVPLLMRPTADTTLLVGSILTQFVYTLGEEVGWRHYLLNATAHLAKWSQAALIGVIWFGWHYSILSDPTTMLTGQALPLYMGVPGLIILLILLSELLGRVVVRTGAVFFATIIHYMGKVGSGQTVLLLAGVLLLTYLLWHKWPFEKQASST